MQRGAMNIFCKKAMNFFCKKKVDRASASRERRTLPFPPGRAAAQWPPEAGDKIALRQVAKADPVTVARLDARAALGKSERGPSVRRQFAVASIAAAMVAASLIGLYFRAEIAAYVTQYAGQQDTAGVGTAGVQVVEQETQFPSQDSQKADSLARDSVRHQQAEADQPSSRTASEGAQVKQGADATRPEAQQPLEKERRRAEALASELAKAQQVIETQVALASKARDQAAQLKQAAESAMAELRQSLQKEHDRAEALASELARARRDIETQVTLPSKTRDEAAQLKQAAKSPTAELRQSLKKEHDRAEALAGELARAQRDIETQAALSSKTGAEAGAATVSEEGARQGRGIGERTSEGAAGRRDAGGGVEQDGRRSGTAQAGCRERDGGTATVSTEGARQGRGAGERTSEGAAGHRDAGGAGEQDG